MSKKYQLQAYDETQVLASVNGSHGDSAEIIRDGKDAEGCVILRLTGPIAVSHASWEGCKAEVELRITRKLLVELGKAAVKVLLTKKRTRKATVPAK